MKTPTNKVIDRAFAKVSSMWGKYEVTPETASNVVFYIHNIESDARYTVDLSDIFDDVPTCTCPAFKHDGFCKHIAYCVEEIQIAEYIESEQAKIDCRGSETDKYAFA